MGILCRISSVNAEGTSLCFLYRDRTIKYEIISSQFAFTPTHANVCIGIIFGFISEDNALSKIKQS